MGTKMKGLLKGLHKISNIFDGKEEQEMQIGFPTDVKHVAHIGWDGPSTESSPGWMNEFPSTNSAPLPATANGSENEPTAAVSPKWSSQDYGTANTSSLKEASAAPTAKPSKRSTSSDAPSADGEPSAVPKHSRRHQSSSDPPSEGSRRSRRERKTSAGSGGSDSSTSSTAAQDASGLPKQSRRKKVAKGSSSGEGSVRSSRSRTTVSSDKGSEQLPVSLLKPMKEDTEGEQQ